MVTKGDKASYLMFLTSNFMRTLSMGLHGAFIEAAILFFVFGILAGLVKWSLEIPPQISRFLSLQLRMALGNEMPASGNFIVAQQVVHRVITRHLLGQAGLKPDEADSGAVTLIQRFGSAANIHLHCLVLDGVYRCGADGVPQFVEAPAPTDEALQAVLHRIITRLTQAAHPSGGAGRRAGFDLRGRQRRRFGRGPHAQAAAGGGVYLPHRLRPARRSEGADGGWQR